MTLARPIVTSDVGELGRVVAEYEAGLVVPPGDHRALADALVTVISDADLAERLGRAAREGILAHSGWETVADRVSAALASAAQAATPHR